MFFSSPTIQGSNLAGKQVDIIVNNQDSIYNLTLIVNKEKSVATGTSFEANCCGNLDNILITKSY